MNLPGLDQLGVFGLLVAFAGGVIRWLTGRVEKLDTEGKEDRQVFLKTLAAQTEVLTQVRDELRFLNAHITGKRAVRPAKEMA